MGAKIKDARLARVPYMAVVGDKEQEAGELSVRSRREDQLGAMKLDALLEKLNYDLENKI